MQGAHAGIYKGPAGPPGRPGLKPDFGVGGITCACVFERGVKAVALDGRLIFELLDEVAMPVQPRNEGVDGAQIHVALLWWHIGHGDPLGVGRLGHFTHRQRAEGQMRRQARAGLGGGDGRGHLLMIDPAPPRQEAVEQRYRVSPSAGLAHQAGVRCDAQFVRGGQPSGVNVSHTCGRNGYRRLPCGHQRFPAGRPSVSVVIRADHAELPVLMPWNTGGSGPSQHVLVAGERPQSSGFHMGVERGDPNLSVQTVKYLACVTGPDDQRQSEPPEIVAQAVHTFCEEGIMATRHVGLLPKLGFNDQQRHDRTHRAGSRERCVIGNPEISFVPDDLNHIGAA